jgi:hypothetical protein
VTSFIVLMLAFIGIVWLALELVLPSSPRFERLSRAIRDRRIARRRRRAAEDPFDVLRLQTRLEAVARQIRALESDRWSFARNHRLKATRAAYDDLLGEACVLAGIDVPERSTRRSDDDERWREERELTARGWSW